MVVDVSRADFGLAAGIVAAVGPGPLPSAIGAVFAEVAGGPVEPKGAAPSLPFAPGMGQRGVSTLVEIRPETVFAPLFVEAFLLGRSTLVESAVDAVFDFSILVEVELKLLFSMAVFVMVMSPFRMVGRRADRVGRGDRSLATAGGETEEERGE